VNALARDRPSGSAPAPTHDALAERRAYEPSFRAWTWSHPEWWLLALSGLAWLEMLAMMGGPSATSSTHGASDAVGAMPGMAGHGSDGMLAAGTITAWALMVVAMMLPLAIGPIRVTAARSLWRRRQRAIVEYAVAFTAIWLVVSAGLLAARTAVTDAGWLGASTAHEAASAMLLIAAGWQLTSAKRRALLACHRAFPLAPTGWRATRDCLRYGACTGRDCVVSCGFAMAALFVDGGLGAMLVVAGVLALERYSAQPRFRTTAAALALLAVAVLLV
jgi:predicted metal-binding membrane protein